MVGTSVLGILLASDRVDMDEAGRMASSSELVDDLGLKVPSIDGVATGRLIGRSKWGVWRPLAVENMLVIGISTRGTVNTASRASTLGMGCGTYG